MTVLSLIFLSSPILAQKNPRLNKVTPKLDAYVNTSAPEKVYLQTDRDLYTMGDTIWFKTYLVNGITHYASDKSKIVHVELLDPNDSLIVNRKLYADDGGAFGDIPITDSMQEGDYSIRAYTKYMLNDREPVLFRKEISILKRQTPTDANNIISGDRKGREDQNKNVPVSGMSKPLVQFFPEGGDLVMGLQSGMGLKITDGSGNGMALKGKIIDGEGNPINAFQTYNFGLGAATITPRSDTKYYAEINVDGMQYKYPVPTALDNGYVVQLKNRGPEIMIKISTNIVEGLNGTFLLGHLRGKVFLEHAIDSHKDSYTISVPTSLLSDGVAQFTLFDPKGEPVCERLVFIENPNNGTAITLKTDKADYRLREKVEVDLALFDAQGKPLKGNFSISAVLDNSLLRDTPTIKSWLLLNSDLGNTVEDPAYFFENGPDTHKYLLDLLMLTHGWRRFVWKPFLADGQNKVPEFPPEKGIMIKGRTTSYGNQYQPKKAYTTLSFLGKEIYQEKTMTNVQGEFSFGPFVFQDSVRAYIKASTADPNKNKNEKIAVYLDTSETKINIDNPIRQKSHKRTILIQGDPKQEYRDKVSDFKYAPQVTELSEVVVQAKKKTKRERIEEKLNKMTMYGPAQNRLLPDSLYGLGASSTVFDLLRQVAGVQVMGSPPNQMARIRGVSSLGLPSDPLFTMNGVPVPAGLVQTMSINDVLFVDVLKGNEVAIYGSRGANGVVAVYTKRGQNFESDPEEHPGVTNFVVQGFYKAREFYSPNYGVNGPVYKIPDYRTTLYWNPDVIIDGNTGTELNFYTGDVVGKYTITVEGITNDGRPLSQQYGFEVLD